MFRLTIEYAAPHEPESFDEHYRATHTPLVQQLPGLQRFTVSRPRALQGEAPYLVAELWFADAGATKAALTSAQMAALGADAKNLQASMVMFSGEVIQVV